MKKKCLNGGVYGSFGSQYRWRTYREKRGRKKCMKIVEIVQNFQKGLFHKFTWDPGKALPNISYGLVLKTIFYNENVRETLKLPTNCWRPWAQCMFVLMEQPL